MTHVSSLPKRPQRPKQAIPLPERPAPEIKSIEPLFARIDRDGVIEGYASLFDVPDLARDVVAPGAFAASLARRGPRGVRMLWQHDAAEPIGRWLDLFEDARGLKARGRLSQGVARAREIAALLADGAIDGLSIGFRTVRARADHRHGHRRLVEIDLWEISIVTFPLLPQARVFARLSSAQPIQPRPEAASARIGV